MTKEIIKDDRVCMCGDLIRNHTGYENHMPVDMHEYYAERKIFEAEEVEAWKNYFKSNDSMW